jgi:hypothetical protein
MRAIRGRIVPLSADPAVAPNDAAVFTGGVWVADDGTVAAVTKGSNAGPPGSGGAPRFIAVHTNAVDPGYAHGSHPERSPGRHSPICGSTARPPMCRPPGRWESTSYFGERFSESDYARVPRGDLPFGVPSWLGIDARGRQSHPKRRKTVERDPADLLHTLIWRAPAG